MKKLIILISVLSLLCTNLYSQRRFYVPGQLDKVEYDTLTKLMEVYPDSSELYSKRGEIAFLLNVNSPNNKYLQVSNEEALKDIKKAIQLNPKRPIHYSILSDYHRHVNKDLEKALEIISKAVEIDSTNPTWLNDRGFLRAKAGLNEKACEDWAKCAKMTGKDADACRRFQYSRCK